MKRIPLFFLLTVGLLLNKPGVAQTSVLEMTTGTTNSMTVPGSGFGPRLTDHIITFEKDLLNDTNFKAYLNPDLQPVTVKISLANQQFTGLTYGQGTLNSDGTVSTADPTGLIFGANVTGATGGSQQQVAPINSYDIMDAHDDAFGPQNGMFTTDPLATPTTLPYPAQSGSGMYGDGSNPWTVDNNTAVTVFANTQLLFDRDSVHSSSKRYYYGDVVLTFSQYVKDPVLHIASLGAHNLIGIAGNDTSTYTWSFYTSELQVYPVLPLTKMSGNEWMVISGNNILNSALRPKSGSIYVKPIDNKHYDTYGAATGSVRINGIVKTVILKVYVRGSDYSNFKWSYHGVGTIANATRDPLAGDKWQIGVSLLPENLIPLGATGFNLVGSLNNNDVLLNWKTFTETNTRHFEIQRSTDAANYTTINIRPAAGNSANDLAYSYIDAGMNVPVYYYRLKLIDLDGKFTYSNVIVIRKPGAAADIRIYPKPASSNIKVEFSNAKGNYIVSLVNQLGQQMQSQKAAIVYTLQTTTLERNNLPAGIYVVRITNDEGKLIHSEKVMIK